MPRPLRIQYENAIYHVMNRGQNRVTVFCDDDHYKKFISLIKDCVDRWQIEVHAFSLMPNHYHLLIQTPHANISRVMRHIDGVFTQWYNRKHKRDGCLFRGRYKSILVEEDAYLVELLRYIHLNPIKAKLVTNPEEHAWSGHRGYMKNLKSLEWMTTQRIMSYFGKTTKEARRQIKKFMKEKIPEGLEKRLSSNNWPTTYSTRLFQKLIEWNFVSDLKSKNVKYKPYRPVKIAPSVIKKVICELYQCQWQQVINPVGHQQKSIRAVALALYSKHLGWTYKKTIEVFPRIHANTLSYAIKRAPEIDQDKWKAINRHLIALKR